MKWVMSIIAIAVMLYVFHAPTWAALLGGLVVLYGCERGVNQYEQSKTHYHDEP